MLSFSVLLFPVLLYCLNLYVFHILFPSTVLNSLMLAQLVKLMFFFYSPGGAFARRRC